MILILAAVAALAAGKLGRAPALQGPADTPAEVPRQPRGWREARHWRKV